MTESWSSSPLEHSRSIPDASSLRRILLRMGDARTNECMVEEFSTALELNVTPDRHTRESAHLREVGGAAAQRRVFPRCLFMTGSQIFLMRVTLPLLKNQSSRCQNVKRSFRFLVVCEPFVRTTPTLRSAFVGRTQQYFDRERIEND